MVYFLPTKKETTQRKTDASGAAGYQYNSSLEIKMNAHRPTEWTGQRTQATPSTAER